MVQIPVSWYTIHFSRFAFRTKLAQPQQTENARSKLDSWLSILFSVWGSETLLCAIIIFIHHDDDDDDDKLHIAGIAWIPKSQSRHPAGGSQRGRTIGQGQSVGICLRLCHGFHWSKGLQLCVAGPGESHGLFSEFFWWSKVKGTSELMNSCRTSAINWWPKGWWIMCFLDISAAYFAMGRLAPERPPPSWERLATWWDVVGSTKCWVHLVSKPLAWGRLRFFSSAESTYGNFQQISHCHQPGKLHLSLDSSLLLHSKIQMCYSLLPSSLAEELETIWVSRVIKNDLQLTFSITVPYVFTTNLFSMMCSEVEPVSEQGLLLRLMNDLFTETLCWR